MKAIVVDHWVDSPAELAVGEAPDPDVGAGMVGIQVKAAGCNFADILMVQGKYQMKPPFPFTPGAEVAGVVEAVGEGVDSVKPGDRVLATLLYGGFAEKASAPVQTVQRIPEQMSFEEAAVFPVVYPTAHAALVHRARLRAGETVLVTAAAGGVGLATVQVAKALGARVIALAGGDEKLDVVRKAGADVAIDYKLENWVDAVKRETGGRGADVIIENVGGAVFDGCTRCIAWDGRLVVVGFAGGKIPEIKANRILLKHIAVIGLFYGMMVQHAPDQVAETQRALFELVEAGKIKPLVWNTYPLEKTGEALAALGSRKSWGKIAVVP